MTGNPFLPESSPNIDTMLRRVYKHHHRNIRYHMDEMATRESAEYAMQYMLQAKQLGSREDLLDFALGESLETGMVMEFGVAAGDSINYIAERLSRVVYGFDSWKGLPEDWKPGFPEGTFSEIDKPSAPDNVELIEGRFEDTLNDFLIAHPARTASFIHVDCDVHSSAFFVLSELYDKAYLQSGTIILFDEYFNYPGWMYHEHQALWEVLNWGSEFEYIGYNYLGEQVVVRVK